MAEDSAYTGGGGALKGPHGSTLCSGLTKHTHAGRILPKKSSRVLRHDGDVGRRVLDGQQVPHPPLLLKRRAQGDILCVQGGETGQGRATAGVRANVLRAGNELPHF